MLPGLKMPMRVLLNNRSKILMLLLGVCLLSSCRLLHMGRYREEKQGCPMTTNIGAEKIFANDPVALKAAKKANKKKQPGIFNN